ncbi:MAG: sialate O-acetylesterase, partial [Clostridiales bacterium]|nr:sialate O-acetylesterase [Clostridiales bacterium]
MDSHKFYIPPIIGEGMVLRFGKGTILWGKDIPDKKVELEFQERFYAVFTDKTGNWKIELNDLEPGGPYELKLHGSEEYLIQQVYVGFVFLLGGQSNMELPLSRVLDLFEEEVKSIHNPYIRQFAVAQEFDFTKKQEEIEGGSWKAATSENIMGFSAAGYFCAAELYEKYKMPIGLICSAVGGSRVEAWLSKEVLLPMNRYTKTLEQFEKDPNGIKLKERELEREQLWYSKVEKEDEGKQEDIKWYHDGLEHKDWKECQMPAGFHEFGLEDFSGVLWLYHEFNLTKEEAESSEILLRLGTIVDADE